MKINWSRLIISVIWILAGPVSIIIFIMIGEFTFSIIHFYLPLFLLISSILYQRWVYFRSIKEKKLYRTWLGLEIERVSLEKEKLEKEIDYLRKLLISVEKYYEREDLILNISIEILKQELEERKSPNKVS